MVNVLREFVQHVLMEYNVQPGVRVYHRSIKRFSRGKILHVQEPESAKRRFFAPKAVEMALENYRKKNHPDLPSRLRCVFGTLVSRSRFLRKGYLYVLEPLGATHVTDSQLIDRLANVYRDDYRDMGSGYELIEPYVPEN